VDIIGLALAILRFVNLLMGYIDREQAKQDGRNEVIAEMALGIAQRVATKKAIQERVDAMSDAEVDAGLRGLEPK
jgi:sensor histidine kinase regulating citrate/malate metabolism